MTLYITTLPKYFPVTDNIRNLLVEKTGEKILISRNPEVIRKHGRIILNIGTSYSWVSTLVKFPYIIFNSPEICKVSGDKTKTYETFKDYVPTVEIKFGVPETYPVIKRNDINSFHGKGIEFVSSKEEFGEEPGYYSQYIKFSAEYRVFMFVLNGKINFIRVFRKNTKPEFEGEDFIPCNAEHCNYYHISEPKISMLPHFLNNIIIAVKDQLDINHFYFGLDIGRVGKKLYLIETNSAPGMNSVTLDKFTDVISALILGGTL